MWLLALLLLLAQGVEWFKWDGSWWWKDDQGYWHKYEDWGYQAQRWQSSTDQWQDWYDWGSYSSQMPGQGWPGDGHVEATGNGHVKQKSWSGGRSMPDQGLPVKGRNRSPSPRHIPTSWRGTRHGDSQSVKLRENLRYMPQIPEEEEEDEMGLGLHSQPSNMPSGLPEEGMSPAQLGQMLQLFGDLFGNRGARYDNRGYRSQIRRQLRFKLKQMGVPQPDWLDDVGQKMSVNEYRDKAFAWMKAVKEGSRVPPPVPEQGLPAEGRRQEVRHLMTQMTDLQNNLGQWLNTLPPVAAEFEAAGPPEGPPPEGPPPEGPAPEQEPPQEESSSSDMDVEDPRKTKSEPPRSPKPVVNATTGLPGEGMVMGPAVQITCNDGNVVVQPAEAAPAPPAPCPDVCMPPPVADSAVSGEGLPGDGSAVSSPVGASWLDVQPPDSIATEEEYNVLDDVSTVASQTLEEELHS